MTILGAQTDDTKFHNIIQGEWFVTHIAHHFEGLKYTNAITGVKFYSYK